jgi:aspartyl-tRNA(Asn)/glutamyl-tRNA(Gln) amidotransferase subunit B
MADYSEAVAAAGAASKPAANWIMGDLQALLTESRIEVGACPVAAEDLAAMIALIENGTISGKIAKELLIDMFHTGKPPGTLVEEKGLVQITDRAQLAAVAREVIAAHPGPVAEYRAGKQKTFGFIVGQMMKATKGKGNPQLVNEILKQELEK